MPDPVFRQDLYRGTAGSYDRFRLPYPQPLINDLVRRTGADGHREAAGPRLRHRPGQLRAAHALRRDLGGRPGTRDDALARRKAEALGDTARFRFLTCAAEELDAPASGFDLVTIGNGFHRMQRDVTAARILRWLRPGGFLALLWGGGPGYGDAPWQQALREVSEHWRRRTGQDDRVPAGLAAARRERPDLLILQDAGFEQPERREFGFGHEWTADELAGHAFSTAVLSEAALGDLAPDFAADLRRKLLTVEPSGRFRQVSTFALELARRP